MLTTVARKAVVAGGRRSVAAQVTAFVGFAVEHGLKGRLCCHCAGGLAGLGAGLVGTALGAGNDGLASR